MTFQSRRAKWPGKLRPRECGSVDILVNNAGAIPQGNLTDLDDKTWRAAWDLKVFGFINLTREVYRDMCARKRGVIVNVIGTAGARPTAGYLAGSMANSALMTMSCALGADSTRFGVRVMGVNPTATATDRGVARWQDRLNPLQKLFAGGCHLNRRIGPMIAEAGLRIEWMDNFYLRRPKVVMCIYAGEARRL